MGVLLIVIGALFAIAGLGDGFTAHSMSAPQQAVQYLGFVVGAAGVVIVGLGVAIMNLHRIVDLLAQAEERALRSGAIDVTPVVVETL